VRLSDPPVRVVPRLFGGLCLVWLPVLQFGLLDWPSFGVWFGYVALWLAAAVALVLGRGLAIAGGTIAVLAIVALLTVAPQLSNGLPLLFWIGAIVAVTSGRPVEQALLLRVLVTTVYGFAAVAKIHPDFLAGDQVRGILRSRERFEFLLPTLEGPWGSVVSVAAIVVEASLAVGLWFGRTRIPTVVVGVGLHLAFVVVAAHATRWDVANIFVLNFALVACYPAFFSPWRGGEADEPRGARPRRSRSARVIEDRAAPEAPPSAGR